MQMLVNYNTALGLVCEMTLKCEDEMCETTEYFMTRSIKQHVVKDF